MPNTQQATSSPRRSGKWVALTSASEIIGPFRSRREAEAWADKQRDAGRLAHCAVKKIESPTGPFFAA